jgi:16S rRNA (uracil1498-N3)-methyltransferase
MVDGSRSSVIATLFCEGPLEPGRTAELGESEAHHARVRRLNAGDVVRLVDGAGTVGSGRLSRLAKGSAAVDVQTTSHVAAPRPVHLLAPMGDRDRMLWLAEKATEIGLTSWRVVMWHRSRGVSPRGEGDAFRAKVRGRMIAALTQSGGAWLPAIFPDAVGDEVVEGAVPGLRVLLDATGEPMLGVPMSTPLTITMGPEGGLEDDERERLAVTGWMPVSLGATTLRFETAGIAALAIARAVLAANVESARG